MKISSATLFVLAAAASVFAQQQQAPLYVTSTYFHAADGKGQAYVEFSRNHTKKIMEAVFQADPAFAR